MLKTLVINHNFSKKSFWLPLSILSLNNNNLNFRFVICIYNVLVLTWLLINNTLLTKIKMPWRDTLNTITLREQ